VIAIGNGTIPTSQGWETEALAYLWNGTGWQALTVPVPAGASRQGR